MKYRFFTFTKHNVMTMYYVTKSTRKLHFIWYYKPHQVFYRKKLRSQIKLQESRTEKKRKCKFVKLTYCSKGTK